MAIQTMELDPNAVAYTNDEIVDKVNAATNQISRADSVSAAARPLVIGEVLGSHLASGASKANLDAMVATDRGYINTEPATGQYKVLSIQRKNNGKLLVDYDDVPV